jgi:hypothetical protein
VLRGLVVLFFLMEFFGYCALGYWDLGLVAIGLQWGLLWCLRGALRWVRWAVWWGIDHAKVAMVTWMHKRRR